MAKKIGLWVLLLSIALCFSSILIQQAFHGRLDGRWLPYPGYDSVSTMALDREDRVWVGFKGGVGVFDGESWTTYTPDNSSLAGNVIEAIAFDGQGRAWIGISGTSRDNSISSEAAISIFDGESWTNHTRANSPLSFSGVSAIAFDQQGRAWIGADEVYVFDGETWHTHAPVNLQQLGNAVNSITFDRQGRAWIGTTWPSIGIFDGESWTIYGLDDSGLDCKRHLSVVFDQQDRAWIYGHECTDTLFPLGRDDYSGGGVNVFDGKTWMTYDKDNSGLAGNEVEALAFDPQGHAWIATREKDGLNVFDGETWITYKRYHSGLVSNDVEGIAFDQQGQAWIATRKDGMSILAADGFPPIAPRLVMLRSLFFSPLTRWILISVSIGLAFLLFVLPRIRTRHR